MAEEQAMQAKSGIDIKVWIAAILLVVGLFVGVAIGRAGQQEVIAKWKETAEKNQVMVTTLDKAVTSMMSFAAAVKAENPDAYQKAREGLKPDAQKDLDKVK